MATVELSTLLPLMRLRGNCNDAIKLQALRQANQRFCSETEAWEDTMSLATVAGIADHTIIGAYGSNVSIKRVMEVKLDGNILGEYEWSAKEEVNGVILTLTSTPTVIGILVPTLILVPDHAYDSCETGIASRYGTAIVKGAEAHLKADPISPKSPVPWYDPHGAALCESIYNDGVVAAKFAKFESLQSGMQQPEHPGFFL